MTTYQTEHITVLKNETVDALTLKPNGVYLDATLGGGGHTRELLSRDKTITVIAFDWDQDALEKTAEAIQRDYGDRFIPLWGNFAHCYRLLTKANIKKIDGVLADFGTSQNQIHERDGFSFQKRTLLDMRMSKSHHYFTAEYVINKFTEKHLSEIFFDYGQERHARKIARAIVEARTTKPLKYTDELADLITRVTPAPATRSRRRIHPATRVFQALRIFINKELENIETFLKNIISFITPGGKIACISFHSLEDRIVKTSFKQNEQLEVITRKPIVPSDEESERNRSSRSAKLRVAEKKEPLIL